MEKTEKDKLIKQLNANIEKAGHLIVEAEGLKVIIAQLAEKPKLGHGDYGRDCNGNTALDWIHVGGKTIYRNGKISEVENIYYPRFLRERAGNIFDELAALKPLEEFVIQGSTIKFESEGCLRIPNYYIRPENITTFILNLRCIEYKLKLEQGGKE